MPSRRKPQLEQLWRRGMDFIERIFGVSPDGGSGATEAMIIVAVIAMGSLIFFYRQQRRKKDLAP